MVVKLSSGIFDMSGILALDVAFANLGWAILVQGEPVVWGTIATEKTRKRGVLASDDYARRCAETASQLNEIIYAHDPKGIVGEFPSGSQNATAAKLLGGAGGIVVAVATCNNLPCEWITEGDSKKAALGKRSAAKEEVMEWVKAKYPDLHWPKTKKAFEHVADAIMAYNGLKNGVLIRAFG